MSAEIEVVEPLDVAAATRLDKRIRLMAATVRDNLTKIADLVAEAKSGQLHIALGFSSWTAYLADAIGSQIELSTDSRRAVVELLAGEGMSNRAIATAVGVTEGTVRNDKVRSDYAPEPVTGLDGKTYKKSGTKKKPDPPTPAATVKSTVDPIEEESDAGDSYTLWSPDVTITVTDRICYDDLQAWTESLYRHAIEIEKKDLTEWHMRHRKKIESEPWEYFARLINDPEGDPRLDVFGATILYLDPLFVIANMATWIVNMASWIADDGSDLMAMTVAKALIGAYEMWDYRVTESIKNTAAAGGDLGE